ncbi:MAG: 50S ribosomal protein L11 methyltransferase [Deltaproteobacteria bacterium]|nr:50S ribosomal protein L11 methyltransferase [Deltaproteobacteria bacterium]
MTGSLIQHHIVLLKDAVRMKAYKAAIDGCVKKGDCVIDIGAGLGILSFLAISAGASKVHAIEVEDETFRFLRLIARHNGLDKKIMFHKGLSTGQKLKAKADVIICELFGNLGVNENIVSVIADAKKRFLKTGGRIIPSGLKVFIAACEHKDWQYSRNFIKNLHGFDLLPDIEEIDLGTPSVIIKNTELISNPAALAEISFSGDFSQKIRKKLTLKIERDGILTGFAGWFDAKLADNVSFSTSPSDLTTHWKQAFLPLRTPQKVATGQQIKLHMEISPDRSGLHSIIGYGFEIETL